MKKDYSLDEARKSNNKFLNRYRDVNPYDHSRVVLSRDDYNYINASHITVSSFKTR
jgi:tyrosine-protein phosphatase non-receptor type 1